MAGASIIAGIVCVNRMTTQSHVSVPLESGPKLPRGDEDGSVCVVGGVRCSSLHLHFISTLTRVPTKTPATAFPSFLGKQDEGTGVPSRQVPVNVKFSFLLKSPYSSSIKVPTLKLQFPLFQSHKEEMHPLCAAFVHLCFVF